MLHPTAGVVSKKTYYKMGAKLCESAAQGPNSFAMRQLQKYGWKEGDGLGKNASGMASHIRVVKREDQMGLGFDEKQEKLLDMRHFFGVYEAAVANGGPIGGAAAVELETDSSSDSSESEEEVEITQSMTKNEAEIFKMCGGRRFSMRAGTAQPGKWKRTEGRGVKRKRSNQRAREESKGEAPETAAVAAAPVRAPVEGGDGSGVDGKKQKKKTKKDKTDKRKKKEKRLKKELKKKAQALAEGTSDATATPQTKPSKKAKKSKKVKKAKKAKKAEK